MQYQPAKWAAAAGAIEAIIARWATRIAELNAALRARAAGRSLPIKRRCAEGSHPLCKKVSITGLIAG